MKAEVEVEVEVIGEVEEGAGAPAPPEAVESGSTGSGRVLSEPPAFLVLHGSVNKDVITVNL